VGKTSEDVAVSVAVCDYRADQVTVSSRSAAAECWPRRRCWLG